jgi:hypothetical protein
MRQWPAAGLRGTWRLLALLSALAAAAYFMQGPSENANSHYALVRAFADGTPVVDRTRHEVGDLGTVDVSLFEGHYYSQKAPGLAMASLPTYLGLEAAGADLSGDPTRVLWILSVFALLVPAFGAALLVERLGDNVAPGGGTAAAVTILLGTLILPFGGLFHAHVLSAALGFIAFAVLWHERAGRPSLRKVVAAGGVAGLAVTAEYTLALIAGVLLLYAASRPARARRAAAYASGVLVGVAPLLLYNWWAFGNPFHVSYSGAVDVGGRGVVGDLPSLLFQPPSLANVTSVLFSRWGLVTSTPVLVAALAGLPLLYRRGYRAEALAIAGAIGVFMLFIASFYNPFGDTFAPRYLIPMLPFFGVPLALAYRSFPLATSALALISAITMTVVTATHPLAAWDARVLERLFSPVGHGRTVLEFVGITGWVGVLPFFALAGAALAISSRAPLRATSAWPAELASAGVAVCGWAILVREAPVLLDGDRAAGYRGALLALFALAVTAAAVVVWRKLAGPPRGRLAGESPSRS